VEGEGAVGDWYCCESDESIDLTTPVIFL
jgi:hypothetical protein